MKTFVRFGSQKNHIIHTVRYEVLGSYQRFLSFADKETAKEIILAMDEKDFPCSIFSTLSHGQVHRGCQMQFRYYIANFIKAIVCSTERKTTESAKGLLRTNVLGPWLNQDNSKELVISMYTWRRNSLRTPVWRCAVELRAANDRLARCQLKQFRASIQPN